MQEAYKTQTLIHSIEGLITVLFAVLFYKVPVLADIPDRADLLSTLFLSLSLYSTAKAISYLIIARYNDIKKK